MYLEDYIYFCGMAKRMNLTYYNYNIAELDAPRSSFMRLAKTIGSFSVRNLPFLILSRAKQKCGGILFSISMLQSPLSNINPVHAMFKKISCDLIKIDKWVGINYAREKVTEA